MAKFGYLYGNKGKRKTRSPKFASEFERNMHSAADKANGFRVRNVKFIEKADGTRLRWL
jgi:hypothetical protein